MLKKQEIRENRYKLCNAAIAFMDILGSGNMIKRDSEEYLNKVHKAYENTILEYSEFINGKFEMPKIKIFSDNIALAVVVGDGELHKMAQLIIAAAAFQLSFLAQGILLRGGVTYGDFFIDEIMVSGNGLLDAYELESEKAVSPKIIIGDVFAEDFKDSLSPHLRDLIANDNEDGKYFINFASKSFFKDENDRKKIINEFLNDIQEKLKKENDEEIINKLEWLEQYLLKSL